MVKQKQHLVKVYDQQYWDLKEYCEDNFEIMAGVISRLIRQFIARLKKKNEVNDIRGKLIKDLKGESKHEVAKDIVQRRDIRED